MEPPNPHILQAFQQVLINTGALARCSELVACMSRFNGFRPLSTNPEGFRGSQAACAAFHRAKAAKAPVLLRGSVRARNMRAGSRATAVREWFKSFIAVPSVFLVDSSFSPVSRFAHPETRRDLAGKAANYFQK